MNLNFVIKILSAFQQVFVQLSLPVHWNLHEPNVLFSRVLKCKDKNVETESRMN